MSESNLLSDVPTFDWLNEDFIKKIVQNQFSWSSDQFKVHSFQVTRASAKGENHLGTLLRVKVNIIKDKDEIVQYYVVKTAAGDGNSSAELANQYGVYPKEMEVYEKVLPAFTAIWKENTGLDVSFGPKCYGVYRDPVEIIVLEDLKHSGYSMGDRLVGFNLAQAKLVVESIAQFHAASMVYLEKYGKFSAKFEDGYFSRKIYDGKCKEYFLNLYKSFKTEVKSWQGFEKIYDKICSWGEDFYLKLVDAVETQESDMRCLAHGDIWVNNIMIQDDNSSDLRFVDYQITCVSTPALDLHFLIANSLMEDNRAEHYDSILVHYQESLERSLKLLGYTKHIPTLREIQHDMFKRSMISNCMTLEGMALVLQNRDNSIAIGNLSESTEEGEEDRRKLFSNPLYVSAVQKYLKFLYERGMLDAP